MNRVKVSIKFIQVVNEHKITKSFDEFFISIDKILNVDDGYSFIKAFLLHRKNENQNLSYLQWVKLKTAMDLSYEDVKQKKEGNV